MTLQKAEIYRVDDTSQKVVCQFNPKDFSISKQVKWNRRIMGGKNVSDAEFAGGEPQAFRVDLVFDSTDTGSDVRDKYKTLLTMGEIDPNTVNSKTGKGQPPLCKFQWGSYLGFTGVLTSVSQNFTLFKEDGTPLRAKVTVQFGEAPKSTSSQNPTTRSEARKIWVVHQGQTLDWIAYREYGDPGLWRYIAETNDLANPMDLRPGQVLKLKPAP